MYFSQTESSKCSCNFMLRSLGRPFMRDQPESSWAKADAQDKAQRLARKEEALAGAQRERKDRQQEDRAGLRPFAACKRARQEAFSIPHVPSELGPTAAPAQRRLPAREAPGGLATRLRAIERRRRST